MMGKRIFMSRNFYCNFKIIHQRHPRIFSPLVSAPDYFLTFFRVAIASYWDLTEVKKKGGGIPVQYGQSVLPSKSV